MRLPDRRSLPLAVLIFIAACGGGRARLSDVPVQQANGPAADYPVVVGDPFVVDGVTYTPKDAMNFDAVGFAASGPDGGETISGAHRTLPLPSYVEVTALDSGKTILVRVERRGPMAGKAQVELSPGAAAQLGFTGQPQFPVRVRRVNPTEPERALLRSGQPAPARMDTPKSLLAVLSRKLEVQEGVVRPISPPEPAPKLDLANRDRTQVAPFSAASASMLAALAKATAQPEPRRFVVRIGAFANKVNADAAVKKSGGFALPSGRFEVVSVGPFASEVQAQSALAKARSAGYADARIQRAN